MNPPSNPSRLLSLPEELRLLIWHFTVVKAFPITITHQGHRSSTPQAAQPPKEIQKSSTLTPALTCRQLNHEIRRIYYTHNTFHILISFLPSLPHKTTHIVSDPVPITWPQSLPWFTTIGTKNLKLIQQLNIELIPPTLANETEEELDSVAPGLPESTYSNDLLEGEIGEPGLNLARAHLLLLNVREILPHGLPIPLEVWQGGRRVMTLDEEGRKVVH
ncbi:uncharacterized protein KY384_005200 [Bacidia gigantensis]|uniref:uncharacterized protein n=1 Tax=Bacidia gigantensis TaxID=2732470 RepID=UPI001D0366C7|nr:uncharacterized protein KY384_005200 [Bacidia gigantensis]KAG8529719.1 hypothetical protein KY384_005200 [Bacidia gigantensis]